MSLRRRSLLLGLPVWAAAARVRAQDPNAVVVIGHAGVPKVDAALLQRLYTGRAIEVANSVVTVVNLGPGHPTRERFLAQVLALDNERYVAYWTVRRHIGKGIPPRELRSAAEVIEFVQSTPGAIGYVSAGDLRPGLNVIYR
jgi:ABC-type phosphate transport system substrate-binding protein